jgi:hypothetical protein
MNTLLAATIDRNEVRCPYFDEQKYVQRATASPAFEALEILQTVVNTSRGDASNAFRRTGR